MEEKYKKELIENTKTMASLLDAKLPISQKMNIVVRLYSNLLLLKSELPTDEYNNLFSKTEGEVQVIIDKLTDPSFIKTFMEKISKISSMKLKL